MKFRKHIGILMRKIGIIANPTSGKDIRRLVSQALVVGNREKVNIVKRVLIGAYAAGAREVMIMPDRYGIGNQSVHDLKNLYPSGGLWCGHSGYAIG